DNERSSARRGKAGFQFEGRARGLLKINGVWRDHMVFAVLRDDLRGCGLLRQRCLLDDRWP
ncbi:hypothetical protein OEZ74_26495, partial [Leclercia adecarboxylata]|uniref:GNAT family N-acetyltransferase n=1 Tax=Leclercia adecarboxylata TaxID=83655 RepID=UPI00236977B6|nr:hypothetical protein [Leclercia adecarboxylata]